jgi:hypothetical protein
MIALAASKEEVLEKLKADIYAQSGVWDLSKVRFYLFFPLSCMSSDVGIFGVFLVGGGGCRLEYCRLEDGEKRENQSNKEKTQVQIYPFKAAFRHAL